MTEQKQRSPVEQLEQQHRIRILQRLTPPLTAAAVLTIALYVLLYWQTEVWQLLVEAGFLAVAVVCALAGWIMTQRGRPDAAGYLMLLGLVVAFCGNELVWDGATWYILVGVILTTVLAGSVVLPHRVSVWVTVAFLSAAIIALLNWLQPLPRYDIAQSAVLSVFIPALTLLLVLATLWQIIHTLRSGTIRTRLLISFVALVVLPASAITAVSSILGTREARERVITQLESVATLKEVEIHTWLESLQDDLMTTLVKGDILLNMRTLLGGAQPYGALRESIRKQLQDELLQTRYFETLFIMNPQGEIVLSTDPEQDGDTYGEALGGAGVEEPWQALKKDFPSPGQVSVLAARPIPTTQGQAKNVLVGCVSLEGLNTLMKERAGLGDSGETYLVGPNHILLTDSRFEGYPAGKTRVDSQGVKATLQELTNGSGLYDDYRDVPVIGVYHWLPELQVVLLAEQDQAEALRATFVTLGLNTVVTVASVLGAVVVGLLVTRGIANPLANLTATAAQIAAGELELEVKVERGDEVGALAQAFNSMTAQLRGLIGGLEERIAQRTRALERRSAYLEASAEVGHAAASILDIDLLMRRVVELIRERFDLYYVGLFQVDRSDEWAVLRAGTGEAGRAMLARGHRIRVGAGMIGWSIANAQPRVALAADADAVRLATAELPDTRSEAALPLRSRGRVLGALSVQDTHLETFDEDSIIMLQTMADQVAVALDNARLFAESQAALEATHRAYGELSREAWSELLHAQAGLGLRRDQRGTSAITEDDLQDEATPVRRVLPIQVRDHVIGVVKARKPQDAGGWTAEEINLLETLVEQLGVALEGARLHQEAQRHAHRERIAREITEKVRAAPDVETIAQTAVEELVKALGGARGFVKLGTRTTDGRETP